MKYKNHPPEDHHKPSEERSVSGDIKIHGAVQIFETESAVKQHEAERKEDQTHKDATEVREKSVLIVSRLTLAITTLYFIATCLIFWQTKKTAEAARDSVRIADTSMKISQRAYVTIGRKDGVIADFIIPKDPKQDAEIIIYFQNSGHLPAKFAWGITLPLNAASNKKPSTGITYMHQFKGLPGRTRNTEDGSMGEQGESTIIAGDSVFVSTLGRISQKDLADLGPNQMGLLILGMFNYCDELGNVSFRQFGLRYRSNAPSSSLSFDLAEDRALPILPLPPRTGTIEYLPPCETSSERERLKKK